ncbi:hypothetical protein HID58_095738 [Brassica napus]|uniref:DUF868 family protein n=1 Tax=Brassica napus TaxID=3708 RepID=A0ABQ7X4Y9_BRANA|nr:hypothetical protein HID58_095738 [Brassica napus]
MRDFPSCSGENGVQVANSPSSTAGKTAQNLVICIYRCRIRGKTCLITVTWTKSLMGQCVTIGVDDSCNTSLCKVEIKPWLFTKRKGSKNLSNISVFWDLSSAKFGSSPEPLGGFYVCVVVDKEMTLLLAQFSNDGKTHDLVIECDVSVSDPCLVVLVDGKVLMKVKRVHWKFRGNDTMVVDRISVEVIWDVHSWFFGLPSSPGHAVFMFRTCQQPVEKTWVVFATGSNELEVSECWVLVGSVRLEERVENKKKKF